MPRIAILNPLAVSVGAFACTTLIHTMIAVATANLVRTEKRLGRMGKSLWIDVAIILRILALVVVAHLAEIGVWAACFRWCGELSDFGTAFYYSAGSYTTLGCSDVFMTPGWRLLGPLEAVNGIILFGVSTSLIFLISLRLAEARFADLRD